MHTIAHGIDLIRVERIRGMLERHDDRFLERVFTPSEQAYAKGRKRAAEHLAARFAAKEAVFKAMGTGLREGMAFTDIEVVLRPSGEPTIQLSGEVARVAQSRGITGWLVSLSHTDTDAIASVIGLGAS